MDIEYWNQFYTSGEVPKECSTFAQSILPLIQKNEPLLELGCGNGRDAIFFGSHNIETIAVDLSETSIQKLKSNQKLERPNPNFVVGDFTTLSTPFQDRYYGTIYSRFTL